MCRREDELKAWSLKTFILLGRPAGLACLLALLSAAVRLGLDFRAFRILFDSAALPVATVFSPSAAHSPRFGIKFLTDSGSGSGVAGVQILE